MMGPATEVGAICVASPVPWQVMKVFVTVAVAGRLTSVMVRRCPAAPGWPA